MSVVPRCVKPGCVRFRKSRGLCLTCYGYARELVKKGKATWTELEAAGKALPLGPKVTLKYPTGIK